MANKWPEGDPKDFYQKVKEIILNSADKDKNFAKKLLDHPQFNHVTDVAWENNLTIDNCANGILMHLRDSRDVNKCIKDILDWFLPES